MVPAVEHIISGLKDFIPNKKGILLGWEKTIYSLKEILLKKNK